MTRFVATDDSVLSEINITPFTDVLLVLLIIFMILAAMVIPPGFEKQLENPSAKPIDHRHVDNLTVTIRKDGAMFIGSQRIDARDLYATIANEVRRNPRRGIELVEDSNASYGLAIRVLDAAKAAGTTNVSLVTE